MNPAAEEIVIVEDNRIPQELAIDRGNDQRDDSDQQLRPPLDVGENVIDHEWAPIKIFTGFSRSDRLPIQLPGD
jgi:hypothetical protein